MKHIIHYLITYGNLCFHLMNEIKLSNTNRRIINLGPIPIVTILIMQKRLAFSLLVS